MKRRLFIALVASILAGLLFWYRMRPALGPQNSTTTSEATSAETAPNSQIPNPKAERSREIKYRLLEKTGMNSKTLQITAPAETDCAPLWTAIANYTFSEAMQPNSTASMPPIPVCKKLPPYVANVHQELASKCGTFSGMRKSDIPKDQQDEFYSCQILLLLYRGAIHDWATKDTDISKSTDLSLLMNKLLSAISRTDPVAIEKVAVRMHELEPNFYEPIKALVIAKIISSVSLDDANAQSEAFLLLERRIQEAKNFGIYDPELLQAEMLMKSRGFKDFDAVKAEGQRIAKEFPERGLGDYAISSAFYHEKNLASARQHLMAAIKKEPENEQFKNTLKELEADPENMDRKIFRVSMGFSLDFNDRNEAVMKQERK